MIQKRLLFTYNNLIFSIILLLIVIMSFVPNVGFIQIGPVAFTIVHIPVIIGALLLGKTFGLILGLIYGLCSMTQAFITGGINLPFTNPVLSVLPRALLGYAVGEFRERFETEIGENLEQTVLVNVFLNYLLNSIGVIIILYYVANLKLYFHPQESGINISVLKFLITVLSTNTVFELFVACAISYPIVKILSVLKPSFSNREKNYF